MRKTSFLLSITLALFLLGCIGVAGLTLSLDKTPVIDDAHIFGNRITEVETAASQLQSQGADIRIRTILNFGTAGNLDQYEAQLEMQSPSWIGQDGDRKNNLIVLIISLQDQKTGLYYGAYWENVIGDRWLSIQTDKMIPLFKEGDYAGGTIQGLAEIKRLIQGQAQTGTQSQATSQPVKNSGSGWIIALVILVIIVFSVGLVLFMIYRKNQAQQQAARHKAILAKQAAASGINELLETTQMLEIKLDVTSAKIAAEDVLDLRPGLEKAKTLVNLGSQKYAELSHSAGDPENPKLGTASTRCIRD